MLNRGGKPQAARPNRDPFLRLACLVMEMELDLLIDLFAAVLLGRRADLFEARRRFDRERIGRNLDVGLVSAEFKL